jgi:glycosyltransferase involved in cell wall biosynthesis
MVAGSNVVVVDSYSADGSGEIAMEFGVGVRYVPAGNMYAAINDGLEAVGGEWCTYVNGDDILYADAAERAISKLGSRADVLYGCVDFIDRMGRLIHSWNSPPPSELAPLESVVMPIPQLGTLFRRAVFEKLGGFDTRYRYASDFDFFLRARKAGFRFARLNYPRIGAFRLHETQISQREERTMGEEVRASLLANQVRTMRLRRFWCYARFRARNWDSYLLRVVRTRHLKGAGRLGRSLSY